MDGQFDINDPIMLLGCLFLGTLCSTCPDATDSNDDAIVDVADATYLLTWRFVGGPPPLPPFPTCAPESSDDTLEDCIYDVELCP